MFPVLTVVSILDDAEGINLEIENGKFASHLNRVLESLWQFREIKSFPPLVNIL